MKTTNTGGAIGNPTGCGLETAYGDIMFVLILMLILFVITALYSMSPTINTGTSKSWIGAGNSDRKDI